MVVSFLHPGLHLVVSSPRVVGGPTTRGQHIGDFNILLCRMLRLGFSFIELKLFIFIFQRSCNRFVDVFLNYFFDLFYLLAGLSLALSGFEMDRLSLFPFEPLPSVS